MFLRMVYDEKLAQAAYLIGCQRTGEAVVFDPERDIDRYQKLAAANGLKLVAAAETHIHADFLSGLRECAEAGMKVYASDEGDADWKYQWLGAAGGAAAYKHQLLKHGDTFKIGNIEFKVVHTPGHTPEHVCFMVTDLGGGATEPIGIITGDFIFVGDLGRPDLLETAAGFKGAADSSARRLYQSAREFLKLPDYLQVWPAHGAGSACGKALGAVPQSTVGYEKRFNPALRAAETEAKFVEFILDGQPEPPLYFARMKRDNKMGPPVLGIARQGLPKPRVLTVDDLLTVDTRKVAIVDTRAWDQFRKGHLPGSFFLPVNNTFSTDAGSLISDDERVWLVVQASQLDEAIRDLIRTGVDHVEGWCEPGIMSEYTARGGRMVSTPEIDSADIMREPKDYFRLDVRRNSEFVAGRIPGATCIVHTRLAAHTRELPRDREILVNCRGGVRSARACALLEREGFRVANLAGGFLAWEKAGGPVEK